VGVPDAAAQARCPFSPGLSPALLADGAGESARLAGVLLMSGTPPRPHAPVRRQGRPETDGRYFSVTYFTAVTWAGSGIHVQGGSRL